MTDCDTGDPIKGVTVTIKYDSHTDTTTTDDSGYYDFVVSTDGVTCTVAFEHDKYYPVTRTVYVPTDTQKHLDVCLKKIPTACPDLVPIQLPVLFLDDGWETWIQVQNVGDDYTKVVMELWEESDGSCQPQEPVKRECSNILAPGAAWTWKFDETYPGIANIRSAIVYSVVPGTEPTDCFGDGTLVPGQPIAVTVQSTKKDADFRSSVYTGISDWLGMGPDPATGAYMYYAPLVFNNGGGYGWTSDIWIQNSGDECTSVEIWYHSECENWEIAEILALAPGESALAPKPSWSGIGSAWIRSTEPLGIIVDAQDATKTMLLTYRAQPVQYQYPKKSDYLRGSYENYGPLVYRGYEGWDAGVQVQNLSSTTNALVKVYFLDGSGDIITTLVDWICKRGSQTFYLPAVNNLPGSYVGQFRVASQNWHTPGDKTVRPPKVLSVVNLINYNTGQGLSYNALPEQKAWNEVTTVSGTTQIALPFLVKQKHDPFEPTGSTWTSKIALTNLVHYSSFDDVVVSVDFFDQNGFLYRICEKLNPKDVDYIDLDNYGVLPPGWMGSALITIQCTAPTDKDGRSMGIGAVVVNMAEGYASGDLTTGYEAFPITQEWPVPYDPDNSGADGAPTCIECGRPAQ